MGLTIKECGYHNAPYIQTSSYGSIFQKQVPQEYRHNVWILAIGNNNPMTEKQAKQDFRNLQLDDMTSPPIQIVIAKRRSGQTLTHIQQDWATFDQMRIVPHHVIDTDAIIPQNIQPNALSKPPCKSTHEFNQHHQGVITPLITPNPNTQQAGELE